MTNILSLPPETIYEIGIQLDSRDNRRLRLVCHRISVAVESLALSKLYIDINQDFLDMTLDQLKELAQRSTRVINYIRMVVIYNSHKTDPRNGTNFSLKSDTNKWRSLDDSDIHVLSSYFLSLASSNVRTLLWFTNQADSLPFVNIIVLYAIKQGILDLSLDLSGGCHPNLAVGLLGIRDLEKLRYKTTYKLDGNFTFLMSRALSKVIGSSPHLTHLEIDTGQFIVNTDVPSLHDILPDILPNQPPIPLKYLSLRSVRTILDQSTLHHLRSLESLSIHFNLTAAFNSSQLPQIWNTLRTESIYLIRIDVNLTDVDDSLLDYLLSYEGLRELTLVSSVRLSSNNWMNAVAHQFFTEVLPKICRTLEILHLETAGPGVWCFGKQNASVIAQCKELKELTVSIVDLIQIHSRETLALLDQTASQLPNLRYLKKVNVATVPQIG